MTRTDETATIQAVIFDLDGVLINSEEWWDEIRSGLAAEHGLPWPADATRRMQGMSTPEWATYLSETVGIPGTADEVADVVISRMAARYEAEVPLIPGAVEAVNAIADNWPIAIASSSPTRLINVVLEASGLADRVRVAMSTEDVEAGKPSPAVYLAVAGQLGCDPAHTVGVEDSSNGLRSASAADLIVVAVPNESYPPAPNALALADIVVTRLSELTPAVVRSLAP